MTLIHYLAGALIGRLMLLPFVRMPVKLLAQCGCLTIAMMLTWRGQAREAIA